MRDYDEGNLEDSNMPMSDSPKMVLKLLVFGFVSVAVTDYLNTQTSVQAKLAEAVGLLSGVLVQQIIRPRLSASKLVLATVCICAFVGMLFLLHL